MENASDALLMAFGVLIFVIALTVAINAFSQTREVSELVIYTADETNFYEFEELTGGASRSRVVGLETIIPTLYRYYKENYTVLFRERFDYDPETGDFKEVRPYELYESPEHFKNLNKHTWRMNEGDYFDKISNKYQRFFGNNKLTKSNVREIYSFDLEEEQLRNEPWTISNDEIKKNLDCFLYGDTYNLPSDGNEYIKYKNGGFMNHSTDSFVENIAEIEYDAVAAGEKTKDEIEVSTTRTKKKKIYIFTLIKTVKNGEE